MDAFLSSILALCGTYLHMKSPLFSFILLYSPLSFHIHIHLFDFHGNSVHFLFSLTFDTLKILGSQKEPYWRIMTPIKLFLCTFIFDFYAFNTVRV